MTTKRRSVNQKTIRNQEKDLKLKCSKNELVIETDKNKITETLKSNIIKRTFFTIVMCVFFYFILTLNKFYLICFVYIIKTLSLKEVIHVMNIHMQKELANVNFLSWYLMLVIDLNFMSKKLVKMYHLPKFFSINREFLCFSLYICGMIFFIITLKGRELKKQIVYFGLVHFIIYLIGLTSVLCINNIENGIIWFAYPCILVITNDVFAFIFGRAFGKTPLIKLSPKKTWEGFIGGFISTLIAGVVLTYLKVNYDFFKDKHDNVLFEQICFEIFTMTFHTKKIYIHSISFILFASLIAPFGGFLASGFKRAFKVKDFGETIPGHGGMMDRMDCQLLMNVFANMYYITFIKERVVNSEKIYNMIINNLNREEINLLVERLTNYS